MEKWGSSLSVQEKHGGAVDKKAKNRHADDEVADAGDARVHFMQNWK